MRMCQRGTSLSRRDSSRAAQPAARWKTSRRGIHRRDPVSAVTAAACPLSAQTGSKRPQAGLPLSAESGHLLRRDEGGLVVLAIQGIAHDLASHADSIGLRSESILNPGRNVSQQLPNDPLPILCSREHMLVARYRHLDGPRNHPADRCLARPLRT